MATSTQINKFLAEIGPMIQKVAKERGYLVCSPIIAQACIESAYGTSSLAYKYHNYFGMKCGSSWKGKSVNLTTKEEYTVGTLTTIKDNFRVYDSMEEGVNGYFDFISTSRYSKLKTATTAFEYLSYIKQAGYATSSSYVNTCYNVVKKYNLVSKYDEEQNNPYPVPTRILKRGIKGEDVKWLQWELQKLNYDVGNIDGSFGPKTEACVKQFQTDKFVDGIVGELTINKLK